MGDKALMAEIFKALSTLAEAYFKQKRSSGMKPFLTLLLIVSPIIATGMLSGGGVATACFILFGSMCAAVMGVGIYFAIKKPDSLRSEEFEIKKYAMAKGLVGDSAGTLREVEMQTYIAEDTPTRPVTIAGRPVGTMELPAPHEGQS